MRLPEPLREAESSMVMISPCDSGRLDASDLFISKHSSSAVPCPTNSAHQTKQQKAKAPIF
jgi:hypothetical protein